MRGLPVSSRHLAAAPFGARLEVVRIVAGSDDAKLQQALDEARVIGESQNFTRDLVNEPSNRMTPTMLGDRAKKMAQEVGLHCEVYGADKIKELKMGASG